MKKKRIHLGFKLDYTTALITGAALLVAGSLAIIVISFIANKITEQNDHTLPLKITNLSYCNGEKLDLIVPQSSTKLPLVIYVHGGGWRYGSKVGGNLKLVEPLITKNFAVASINYSLSHSAPFPAQIQDVTCAVRYLRKNAYLYNIDSTKIGLVGISAGAHLSALAANASDMREFTKGDFSEISSTVQASVSINGLLNLEAPRLKQDSLENISRLLGDSKFTKATASPSSYISARSSPQLIIYSQKDKTVLPEQSLEYIQLAKKNSVEITSLNVERAGHNLEPYFALSTKPSRADIVKAIEKFFATYLK